MSDEEVAAAGLHSKAGCDCTDCYRALMAEQGVDINCTGINIEALKRDLEELSVNDT
jgi:hypothetical protein